MCVTCRHRPATVVHLPRLHIRLMPARCRGADTPLSCSGDLLRTTPCLASVLAVGLMFILHLCATHIGCVQSTCGTHGEVSRSAMANFGWLHFRRGENQHIGLAIGLLRDRFREADVRKTDGCEDGCSTPTSSASAGHQGARHPSLSPGSPPSLGACSRPLLLARLLSWWATSTPALGRLQTTTAARPGTPPPQSGPSHETIVGTAIWILAETNSLFWADTH